MFMVSFRLDGRKVLMASIAVALVVAMGIVGVRLLGKEESLTPAVKQDVGTEQTKTKVKAKKVAAKTNEQRLSFLRSFGWEIGDEPLEVMEVIIPQEFDEVYSNYNVTQKKQGYDLKSLAGKRVKRYSYVVTNYPDSQEEVRVNLLVYKDKVVGGDVCSLTPGGFLHGFTPELKEAA